MGKKRGATVAPAAAAPVFPFPVADDDYEPWHFSDYGFDDDPRLRCFPHAHATAKRPVTTRRHHRHQTPPPPLESGRFKLQKPISKKQQQRRRWWSSAASAALLFFKRGSSSDATASVNPSPSSTAVSPAGPLYLAVDEDYDGAAAACACWAPAVRSGHLAASELGASAAVLPYVSLRDSSGVSGGGGAPPAMPIYLVT